MANKPMKMKKCKYCNSDMFYYGKVCPHCGKDQTNKVLKYTFLTCIVIVIVAMAMLVETDTVIGQQLTTLFTKMGMM